MGFGVFGRIAISGLCINGSAPCYSRRGKSREVLCNELMGRLHPRRRDRRRVNPRRIHMLPGKSLTEQTLGRVGENVYERTLGYDSWDDAIRVARTSSERAAKAERIRLASPEFDGKGSMRAGGSQITDPASDLK